MKNDSNRVELVALPVVLVLLGVLFALMIAADVGPWAWAAMITALVVLGLLAIALVIRRHRHPAALDAPSATLAPSGTGSYRVLVIADESLTAEAIRDELAPHAAGRPLEAFVLAPALRSRLAHWTEDDSRRDDAEAHLARTLDGFTAAGIRARGEIGSDDPIQAADDGLRTFAGDEVVFVTGHGDSNWLEQGIVDMARGRYDLRVTHIETSPSR
jgi:hypothetical protein